MWFREVVSQREPTLQTSGHAHRSRPDAIAVIDSDASTGRVGMLRQICLPAPVTDATSPAMHRFQILMTVIGLATVTFASSWIARRVAWATLAGSVGIVLYATLRSGPSVASADCSLPADLDARVFDVVQNIVLLVPLGMAVATVRSSHRIRVSVLAGAALSACVEVAQRFDVTRCSSVIDVVSNACGAFVGAGIIVGAHRFLDRPS